MKQLFQWVFAATLICGLSVFTACSSGSDDNQEPVVKPDPVVNPDPDDNGANSSSDVIGYIECSWNGTEVVKNPLVKLCPSINDITAAKEDQVIYTSGFFYVTGTHTIEGGIGVQDDKELNIILCDGAELKVQNIAVDNATLRIFGQEKGTGKLTITDPGNGDPAIGPYMESGGTIEIHGGVITANGGKGAAGIGAGYLLNELLGHNSLSFKSIVIFGGTINATGGAGSAGIGNGVFSPQKGKIEIYGGDITAQGGGYYTGMDQYGGAGIGGGCDHAVNSIYIYDGNIKAYGGTDAAGIGCGEDTPNGEGTINICGGTIVAQGGDYAAGIGGGDGVRMKVIEISGGTVYAYAGKNGAGIGGGEGGESGDITISGGIVRAYGDRYYTGSSNSGYGSGIGSGQAASVNTIIIKGGDIEAYGGEDGAGIGTGEEYGSDINSGTIEIHGGKVWAEGKGYGAGIGCGEDATFGVLGISGGRVDAHAGSDCGPWSGGIGAYHKDHGADDNCHIGWAGWERIYIGKGMRLWTHTPFNGPNVETVTNNLPWWNYVHQRPQAAFDVCDHPGYTEATCPFCYRETIQLR